MSRREDFLREVVRQGQEIATLRADLAERDARIAALTKTLRIVDTQLQLWMESFPSGVDSDDVKIHELARVTLDPSPPYRCTSDQYTHTHHYPHGDEGDA